jgi:CRISPR/Cas system-associated protein Cas5 (RAMP superfamily)
LSSLSFSLRRSCSPWGFTFRVFPFITKAIQGLPCSTRSS